MLQLAQASSALSADDSSTAPGEPDSLVFGFFIMKKLVWNLADEVLDCGNALLVRNAGDEERIPLSNIMNVSASVSMNPQRITLRLVRPGRFGPDVVFSPIANGLFSAFGKNKIAEDLIERVYKARA